MRALLRSWAHLLWAIGSWGDVPSWATRAGHASSPNTHHAWTSHHLLLLWTHLSHHVARMRLLLRVHLLLRRHPHHCQALHRWSSSHLLHSVLLQALLVHCNLLLLLRRELTGRHSLALHELLVGLHGHGTPRPLHHLARHHFTSWSHLRPTWHWCPLNMDHSLRVLRHLVLLGHGTHGHVGLGMLLWPHLLLWVLLLLLLLIGIGLLLALLGLHILLLLCPVVTDENIVLPELLPDLLQRLLDVRRLLRDPRQLRLVLVAQVRLVLLHGPLAGVERLERKQKMHTRQHTQRKKRGRRESAGPEKLVQNGFLAFVAVIISFSSPVLVLRSFG